MGVQLHSFLHPSRELSEVNGYKKIAMPDHGIDLTQLPRSIQQALVESKICIRETLSGPLQMARRDLSLPDVIQLLDAFLAQSRFVVSTCGSTLILEAHQIGTEPELRRDPLGQGYIMMGSLYGPSTQLQDAGGLALTATLSHLAQWKKVPDLTRQENLRRVERASFASGRAEVRCFFPDSERQPMCQIAFTPLA